MVPGYPFDRWPHLSRRAERQFGRIDTWVNNAAVGV
jgi:NAD(P)-dependent dehydrogenase (short-subunit alcohol dehydrogenase family)